jgi:hypothetical protein
MALTILSLAEYTLLSNVCINSSIYITASPRRLHLPFAVSSLRSTSDHPEHYPT